MAPEIPISPTFTPPIPPGGRTSLPVRSFHTWTTRNNNVAVTQNNLARGSSANISGEYTGTTTNAAITTLTDASGNINSDPDKNVEFTLQNAMYLEDLGNVRTRRTGQLCYPDHADIQDRLANGDGYPAFHPTEVTKAANGRLEYEYSPTPRDYNSVFYNSTVPRGVYVASTNDNPDLIHVNFGTNWGSEPSNTDKDIMGYFDSRSVETAHQANFEPNEMNDALNFIDTHMNSSNDSTIMVSLGGVHVHVNPIGGTTTTENNAEIYVYNSDGTQGTHVSETELHNFIRAIKAKYPNASIDAELPTCNGEALLPEK